MSKNIRIIKSEQNLYKIDNDNTLRLIVCIDFKKGYSFFKKDKYSQ